MLCVVSFFRGDRDQAVRWSEWVNELGPYPTHDLLIVRDHRAEPIPHLGSSFRAVKEIVIRDDAYDKWPESPNLMLRRAAKQIEYGTREPWLWIEVDAIPLKTGWIDAIETEYKEAGKPFSGDFVHVPEMMDVPDHCSGIAVYPGSLSSFAGTAYLAHERAWDVEAAAQIVPQMHKSKHILHRWKHPPFENWQQVEERIFAVKPEAVLFHADKSSSLVDLLREKLFQSRKRGPNGTNDRQCNVEGCSNQAFATGVCRMHYARKERNGNYDLQTKLTTAEKLLANREISPSGCWLWTGGTYASGYGEISIGGSQTSTHRASFEIFVGQIPEGLNVCHKCDVRPCFNPDHLFLGTDVDNMRDAAEKGRIVHGEDHQWTKLTDAQVNGIRQEYSEGSLNQHELADKYGCSQGNISMIVRGLTRKLATQNFTTDIFLKTFPPDYGWAKYCLRSIEKFARGFDRIIIVSSEPGAPNPGAASFEEIILPEPAESDGYLWQQIRKLHADLYTDSDFICTLDSDTIFTRPVTPQDYFTDGRIDWMMTPYSMVETPWKPITEKFLGRPVEFEFMRRAPVVLPRWIYDALRRFCANQHGRTLEQYIIEQPHRAFSEYNAIGAFAYYFHHDTFNWINTGEVPESDWPALTVLQKKSWDGLTPQIVAEFEEILKGDASERRSEILNDTTQVNDPASRDAVEHDPITSIAADEINPNIKQTKQGIWVLVNDTHISRWVEEKGSLLHDYQTQPVFLPEIPEGGTVIDGGAFIGDTTAPFLDRVGPTGKVLAFEPNPDARECLRRNCPNAVIFAAALGDSTEDWVKMESSPNAGANFCVSSDGKENIPVCRLDALLNDFARLDFIKLDIEGMELQALRGAEQTINRFHPKLLLEINEGALQRQGTSAEEISDWLFRHGYKWRPIQPNITASSPQYDILCTHIKTEQNAESCSTSGPLVKLEPDAKTEVRRLAEQIKGFMGGSVATRRVRNILHEVGVIELPYRFRKRKGWKRKKAKA